MGCGSSSSATSSPPSPSKPHHHRGPAHHAAAAPHRHKRAQSYVSTVDSIISPSRAGPMRNIIITPPTPIQQVKTMQDIQQNQLDDGNNEQDDVAHLDAESTSNPDHHALHDSLDDYDDVAPPSHSDCPSPPSPIVCAAALPSSPPLLANTSSDETNTTNNNSASSIQSSTSCNTTGMQHEMPLPSNTHVLSPTTSMVSDTKPFSPPNSPSHVIIHEHTMANKHKQQDEQKQTLTRPLSINVDT